MGFTPLAFGALAGLDADEDDVAEVTTDRSLICPVTRLQFVDPITRCVASHAKSYVRLPSANRLVVPTSASSLRLLYLWSVFISLPAVQEDELGREAN